MVGTTHVIVKIHNEGYKFLWNIEEREITSGGKHHKKIIEYKALGSYSEGEIYMSVLSEYSLSQSIKIINLKSFGRDTDKGRQLLIKCHRNKRTSLSGQPLYWVWQLHLE